MDKQWGLKFVITEWQKEVDTETIRLIEAGVEPCEASDRAVRIVSRRWKKENADMRKKENDMSTRDNPTVWRKYANKSGD